MKGVFLGADVGCSLIHRQGCVLLLCFLSQSLVKRWVNALWWVNQKFKKGEDLAVLRSKLLHFSACAFKVDVTIVRVYF
jgi:hypothetical protein